MVEPKGRARNIKFIVSRLFLASFHFRKLKRMTRNGLHFREAILTNVKYSAFAGGLFIVYLAVAGARDYIDSLDEGEGIVKRIQSMSQPHMSL